LENLAFAFCADDVRVQGQFLEELLAPRTGFCCSTSTIPLPGLQFRVSPETLIDAYPTAASGNAPLRRFLERSRGLDGSTRHPRRPVPEELFPLLDYALRVCPEVEAVIFEHLGNALPMIPAAHTISRISAASPVSHDAEPSPLPELEAFQAALLNVLHEGGTPQVMRTVSSALLHPRPQCLHQPFRRSHARSRLRASPQMGRRWKLIVSAVASVEAFEESRLHAGTKRFRARDLII